MLLQKKMIDKEISNLKAIDTLIRQEQPLAVYRIPGEDTPRLLTQASGSVRLLYDLKDLDGARGFVIAPFRASESCPIVLIQPEQWGHPLPLGEYAEEELEAFRLTMTVTEADAVPLETTMEVAPVPTAVMTPLALTVATLVSLDLKVRDWEAEDGVTLPVMVRLAPGLRTT